MKEFFIFFTVPLEIKSAKEGKKRTAIPQPSTSFRIAFTKKTQDVVLTGGFLLCIEPSYEGFALLFTAKPYLKLHFPCNRNFTRSRKLWPWQKWAFIPNTHKSTDLLYQSSAVQSHRDKMAVCQSVQPKLQSKMFDYSGKENTVAIR